MKPFGELSREEKLELMTAWVYGKPIQSKWGDDKWRPCDPLWIATSTYRVAPPLPIKATIPWEHIKPEYKWAAMDENGSWFCFEKKPEKGTWAWLNSTRTNDSSMRAVAFPEGNMPWEQSLVERT